MSSVSEHVFIWGVGLTESSCRMLCEQRNLRGKIDLLQVIPKFYPKLASTVDEGQFLKDQIFVGIKISVKYAGKSPENLRYFTQGEVEKVDKPLQQFCADLALDFDPQLMELTSSNTVYVNKA